MSFEMSVYRVTDHHNVTLWNLKLENEIIKCSLFRPKISSPNATLSHKIKY